jgi:hypothetical protein
LQSPPSVAGIQDLFDGEKVVVVVAAAVVDRARFRSDFYKSVTVATGQTHRALRECLEFQASRVYYHHLLTLLLVAAL